jgi:hypothetical protein
MKTTQLLAGMMMTACLMTGCKEEAPTRQASAAEQQAQKEYDNNRKKIDALNKQFFKVPDDKILENGPNTPIYAELKQRYKKDAAKLKEMVEGTGAKVVFMILTPETGNDVPGTRYGIPYIRQVCNELGIELLDMTPILARKTPKEITQWPIDGHWSKKGAEFIADNLAPIIRKYSTVTSTVTYKDSERPETFGDLEPNSDEIRDGGKDLPYHVKGNAQGVRMDSDIMFPKKKKHVLFMGDSGIFCPFLNNEFTITAVLQRMFPDMVMMNTGIICYTLEDYVTLWNEKSKYSEPDIVIIQTNGGDITDYFFTHRNTLSRSHKPFQPTPVEEEYYRKAFPNAVN